MRAGKVLGQRSRKSPSHLPFFLIFFLTLLLMSGIHIGLIVLGYRMAFPTIVQVLMPMLYWILVAVGLTLFSRWEIRRNYEEPVRKLQEAMEKVANGNFSIYVPPRHVLGEQDYLDAMILDFNKMVEELGSIEVLKTDFVSNVSHEIKTPLAVIHNNTQLLQGMDMTDERQRECTEAILHATRRLSNLITNILKLNRLEKQAIQSTPEQFDLCAQLTECALQFEDQWDEKDIEFVAELEDRVPVHGDEELLALVWTNLLSNAIKFTPSGGTVTLSQTSDDDTVTVTVADTGCGMDSETIRHIFDKFYQGDTSHATEGNGLGLSLVRRILELVDGTISVRSTVGAGTAFAVCLPKNCHEEGTGQ